MAAMGETGSLMTSTSLHHDGSSGTDPERPRTATTASVLGIITGSLALPPALGGVYFLVLLPRAFKTTDPRLSLWGFLALISLLITIVLLIAGITFLKGKGYTALLSAATGQIILTTFHSAMWVWSARGVSTVSDSLAGIFMFAAAYTLIDLGLAISTLIALLKPAARQWGEQSSRPTFP